MLIGNKTDLRESLSHHTCDDQDMASSSYESSRVLLKSAKLRNFNETTISIQNNLNIANNLNYAWRHHSHLILQTECSAMEGNIITDIFIALASVVLSTRCLNNKMKEVITQRLDSRLKISKDRLQEVKCPVKYILESTFWGLL